MDVTKIEEHLYNPALYHFTRDHRRIKQTAEVFTPRILVDQLLDNLPSSEFESAHKTFLDHSCGDGAFLAGVLLRKLRHGHSFEQSIRTIFGVDLMEDNVTMCRNRLLCGYQEYRPIVENNIICADALRYHYRFDGSYPYDDEQQALI